MPCNAALFSTFLLLPYAAALKQQTNQQVEHRAEGYETRPKKSFTMPAQPLPVAPQIPDYLNGHNILLFGDSNERIFIQFLCETYGAEVQVVNTATCKNQLLEFPFYKESNPYPAAYRFCHIPKRNISVMSAFHNGVLTTGSHERWHAHVITSETSEHAKADIPHVNGTTTVVSSADLVCFWTSAVASNLPERPVKVVVQSSLWDSVMAKKFLEEGSWDADTIQRKLSSWGSGWNISDSPHSALKAWGWMEHVELLLRAVQIGFGVQELYWRTNPNCPVDDAFVNGLSEAQAAEMRQRVDHGKGIWTAVSLIDWRMHYRAGDNTACDFIHYRTEGYKAYLDLLWARLAGEAP
ncbi:unnamed protein product [Prorocentrum cordatum]|uniref:Uncharacterized protein n=1 Tax=Prorocentrum cordatum TaxID=2364126 RepID=A0ABN9US60_9DINO|nr:unnamed protein product [Polarella glacialis]|mmetsp:Transcript_78568/g.204904  ORF Transcript_78568/g.204904 Transcript_78568/m.204904 type:complete len:352 (-) Transcript_78568:213-1268(-)